MDSAWAIRMETGLFQRTEEAGYDNTDTAQFGHVRFTPEWERGMGSLPYLRVWTKGDESSDWDPRRLQQLR